MAEKLKIPVRGMHCAACVLNVENSLKQIDVIRTARVNLDEQSAYIEIENGNLKADEIVERIKKSGYEVPVEERRVKVKGMHCAACVLNVENALKKVPVVLDARVNLDEEMAYVKVIPVENIEELISEAISKAGYEYAEFMEEGTPVADMETQVEEELNQKKRRIWVSLPIGILLMLGNHSAIVPFLKNPLIQLILAFPAFVYAASPILKA
ncbi:MAG: hypothetical protein D6732_12160, partial [Methanobacteriota archaeon]